MQRESPVAPSAALPTLSSLLHSAWLLPGLLLCALVRAALQRASSPSSAQVQDCRQCRPSIPSVAPTGLFCSRHDGSMGVHCLSRTSSKSNPFPPTARTWQTLPLSSGCRTVDVECRAAKAVGFPDLSYPFWQNHFAFPEDQRDGHWGTCGNYNPPSVSPFHNLSAPKLWRAWSWRLRKEEKKWRRTLSIRQHTSAKPSVWEARKFLCFSL